MYALDTDLGSTRLVFIAPLPECEMLTGGGQGRDSLCPADHSLQGQAGKDETGVDLSVSVSARLIPMDSISFYAVPTCET